MKKIITIASLAFATSAFAQTYKAIPDSNFVHYLKTIVPAAFKGDSLNTSSTLVTTTTHSITCNNSHIANIFGAQYFTSLIYLNCGYNNLTTLPALPNTLNYLDCNSNFLTTLPTLPNSLNSLTCELNFLTSLPSLPNSLQVLACNNNNIACFPTFPNSILTNYFGIDPNPYNCLPNYIAAMGSDTVTYPKCAAGNSNGCAVAGI